MSSELEIDQKPDYKADALIRRMWAKWQLQKPVIDLAEDSHRIADHLMQHPQFIDIFVRDYLPETVREIGEHLGRSIPNTVRAGGVFGTRAEIKAMVRREIEEGFADWIETDPATRRQIKVADMTRPQLLAAADVRQERAHEDASRSAWYRQIAGKLGDGQTVREVWSAEALRELRESIHVTVGASTITPLRAVAD